MNKYFSRGAELIRKERQEQVEKHGFDEKHDADYGKDELSMAASVCFHLATAPDTEERPLPGLNVFQIAHFLWPWKSNFGIQCLEKIIKKSKTEQFVIAGAFLAAELDRTLPEETESERLIRIMEETVKASLHLRDSLKTDPLFYRITHAHLHKIIGKGIIDNSGYNEHDADELSYGIATKILSEIKESLDLGELQKKYSATSEQIQARKQAEFKQALKVVTDTLNKDAELRQGYVANIAMPFYDAFFKRHAWNEQLSGQIHEIANEGANYFIDALTGKFDSPDENE